MTEAFSDKKEDHLKRLVELGIALSSEHDIDRLLEMLLLEAKAITNADGGTLYLVGEDDELHFSFVHNDRLKISMGGTTGKEIPFSPLKMYNSETGEPNHNSVATHAALTGEVVNIPDAYDVKAFDFSGAKKFDKKMSYRSKSFLTVPLKNHQKEVIGVLQLINSRDTAADIIPFSMDSQKYAEALASQSAIAIDNQRLLLAQRHVMESFIEVIAKAIDSKSPYTGAHCQRVPVIAKMLALSACVSDEGIFANFDPDEDEWYTLHLASWLHDCGKVTTPEYVVDKATKLETINNRIHEIRTRFEVLYRDAEVEYYKKRLAGGDKEALTKKFQKRIKELRADYVFISECNIGGFLSDDKMERIEQIGKQTWTRHFDRTLGLSWGEKDNIKDNPPPPPPVEEQLLEDRPEHIFSGYNRGEIYNLSVKTGTLTAEERDKVNNHIVQTIEMLGCLPFPKAIKQVPEYAGAHHERVDGKGYPNGLKREEMSIPARIMAIADIFEALTSTDRPYKSPKTLSETIKIMALMKKDGHIDPDLFDLFLKTGVHEQYAEQYMKDFQIDEVSIEQYLD